MSSPKRTTLATSWPEAFALVPFALSVPFVAAYQLSVPRKGKKWRRKADSVVRYLIDTLSIAQIQASLPGTLFTYNLSASLGKYTALVEEVGEDARLLWIGPKRTDKVVLWFHGGGFVCPMQEYVAAFARYVQLQLQQTHGREVGFAILHMSLAPTFMFPTQLRQAIAGINHLVKQGLNLSNLHLGGDSAGGNLTLQLLSHTLHPISPTLVQPSPLGTSPLGGVCLVSPWATVRPDITPSSSYTTNSSSDFLNPGSAKYWGDVVVEGIPGRIDPVPQELRVHLEPNTAPAGWWNGVDKVAGRFIMTVGGKEGARDDLLAFGKVLEDAVGGSKEKFELLLQEDGGHEDPLINCTLREESGDVEKRIVDWFAAGN